MIGVLLRWERICLEALGVSWFPAAVAAVDDDEEPDDDHAIPLQQHS